jgi:NADH-quinone oxidoreductase subunit J
MVEVAVFFVCAAIVLIGAGGVITSRNPVHAALSLVATLFGIAVLFIAQDAQFLAAVQVIVYAGAIVILFLFVIMLLGVDSADNLDVEPIAGQRPLAAVAWAGIVGMLLTVVLVTADELTGRPASTGELDPTKPDVNQIGEFLFTKYAFAFEVTALLLTIAVIGAVVLARRATGELAPIPSDALAERAEASQADAGQAEAAPAGTSTEEVRA